MIGIKMRGAWFPFLLLLSIGCACGQSYTYVSPTIKDLGGFRFTWKMFNGWRLISPAEGAVYSRESMNIMFQKADMKNHRLLQLNGVLYFSATKRLRDKKVLNAASEKPLASGRLWIPEHHASLRSVEAVIRVPRTDRNLWVQIQAVPKEQTEFWAVEIGKIQLKAAR